MPFDFKAYDAKCYGLTPEELQREWQHYTRLISGASTSTAVSGLALPLTCGVSVIGVGMAAPAIHNARKKREIIERHLQRHNTTHQTRKRDVLGSMAFSGTIGLVTLGVGTMGADAIAANGAEHGICAVVENETAIKVVTHAALDGVGMAAEHKHTSHVKKKEAHKAFAAAGVFQAVEDAKAKEAGYSIQPYNPQTYGESSSLQQGQQYQTYADPNWVQPPPSYAASTSQPVYVSDSKAPMPVQDQSQYAVQPGVQQQQTFHYGPPEAPTPSQQQQYGQSATGFPPAQAQNTAGQVPVAQYTYPAAAVAGPQFPVDQNHAQQPSQHQPQHANTDPQAPAAYNMHAMADALPALAPAAVPAWNAESQQSAHASRGSISRKPVAQQTVAADSNATIRAPFSDMYEEYTPATPPPDTPQASAEASTQPMPSDPVQTPAQGPIQETYSQPADTPTNSQPTGGPHQHTPGNPVEQHTPLQSQGTGSQHPVPAQPAHQQHVDPGHSHQPAYVAAAQPVYEPQATPIQSQTTGNSQYTIASTQPGYEQHAASPPAQQTGPQYAAPAQSAQQYATPVQPQPAGQAQYAVPAQPTYQQQPAPVQQQHTGHSQYTPQQVPQQAPIQPQQTGSSTYYTQTPSSTLVWNGTSYVSTPSHQVSPATTGTSVPSGYSPLQHRHSMSIPPPPPGPPPASGAAAARRQSYHPAQGQYGYQPPPAQPQAAPATYQTGYQQPQAQAPQQPQPQHQYQPQAGTQVPHQSHQYPQQQSAPPPQPGYNAQIPQQQQPQYHQVPSAQPVQTAQPVPHFQHAQQPQYAPQPQYQQPAYQQPAYQQPTQQYPQQPAPAQYAPGAHPPPGPQRTGSTSYQPMTEVTVQGAYSYQQQWASAAAPPAQAPPPPMTGATATSVVGASAAQPPPSTGGTGTSVLGMLFG